MGPDPHRYREAAGRLLDRMALRNRGRTEHEGPAAVLAARQVVGRFQQHQRHGFRAGRSEPVRPLARCELPRLGLRRRAARIEAARGSSRRRPGISWPRRTDSSDGCRSQGCAHGGIPRILCADGHSSCRGLQRGEVRRGRLLSVLDAQWTPLQHRGRLPARRAQAVKSRRRDICDGRPPAVRRQSHRRVVREKKAPPAAPGKRSRCTRPKKSSCVPVRSARP